MNTPQPPAASGGRFEVSLEKFSELTTGKPETDILTLDIKEVLPQLFASSDKIPRALDRAWRKACDNVIAEDRGIYCHKGGTVVLVFFYELAGAIAKGKLAIIKGKILEYIKLLQAGQELPEVTGSTVQKQKEQVGGNNPELSKLIKEGLGDNPTIELLQLWVSRTLQAMAHHQGKTPLTQEMMDVVTKSDVAYAPLWNAGNQALVGSFGLIRGSVPSSQYKTGEMLRQDLAILFSSCFQLYSMQSKGQNALMSIPVQVSTLLDKQVSELYVGFLRRLSPEVKKAIIFEVKNVPKDSVPTNLIAAMENISIFSRAFIFKTGMMTHVDYMKGSPKLHASGFDIGEAGVPMEEQLRLLKKYAAHCQKTGVKAFIKGVKTSEILQAAVAEKFTYISGSLIRPMQKAPFGVQKLGVGEIK